MRILVLSLALLSRVLWLNDDNGDDNDDDDDIEYCYYRF